MLAPSRSPKRLPPPPSPSKSLLGMEKVIAPRTRSPNVSPFSSVVDVNKPLPPRTPSSNRSPFSIASNKDKPLPETPRMCSSVYSSDSDYSRSAEPYSNHGYEEESTVPLIIQPIAYKDTISALLRRRLDDPPSPKSVPSAMSAGTLDSQTWPHPGYATPESPTMSAVSAPSAADSRSAPSFREFSRNLQNKRIHAMEMSVHPSPSPQFSPKFRAASYESARWSPDVSPRTSETVDRSLLPSPLTVGRYRDTLMEGRPKTSGMFIEPEEERSLSRFSSSDDSHVIHNGVRKSVRAYVRHKLHKKRGDGKKERKKVMSAASAKYPAMLTAKEHDRKHSSGLRKTSLQQGFSSVYDKISKLSISGSSSHSKTEREPPRGRKKQLAIPTSDYQKYGAAAWEAPKREKKPKRSSAPARTKHSGQVRRQASISGSPAEVVGAFKSGRRQIIHALDDQKHKLKRSDSEKRREALRQSIKLVGPADHVSDGRTEYHI
jgi:hypothetical protein